MRFARGILTLNVLPSSTELVTAIAPPCNLTSSCTNASPIPVPCAAAAVFDAVKAFQDIGQLFRWNADAGVFKGEFRLTVDLHQSNRDAALQRELECVADQIRIIFSHMSRST